MTIKECAVVFKRVCRRFHPKPVELQKIAIADISKETNARSELMNH